MTAVPPEADAQRRGFSVSSVTATGRNYSPSLAPGSGIPPPKPLEACGRYRSKISNLVNYAASGSNCVQPVVVSADTGSTR